MKIGLYGIYGVYNFGCEAIIRGAEKFIHELYPNSEIIYFSYNYDFDNTVLKNLPIEVRPVIMKKTIYKRVKNKILNIINSEEQKELYFDYKNIIDSVDMIVSIGGDIYTIPEVLRKQNKYPYYNSLVDFCNKVIENGKEVIVYGASIGPFGNYQNAVNYYKKHLEKYKIIVCRERVSIEYLQSIGLNNVCFFPDPAFLVKGVKNETCQLEYIGVNFSPLSLHEIYGNCREENCRKLAELIDEIYDVTRKKIMFFPHVFSSNSEDDDLVFMKTIYEFMKNKEQVKFADYRNGFLGLKPEINQCYALVSARMHCAVNAICENTPVIFLSYSQKSIGMCEYVYGTQEWVVDLKAIEDELIPKIQKLLQKRDMIAENLKVRNKLIDKYYQDNISQIKTKLL